MIMLLRNAVELGCRMEQADRRRRVVGNVLLFSPLHQESRMLRAFRCAGARALPTSRVRPLCDFLNCLPDCLRESQRGKKPAGTQMVGGGFSSDPYVAVYSSYPSGPSTWTIVGGNYGGKTPVPIIAYATCVQADFSLGLTIAFSAVTDVRSGTPANVIASCPASSTVLGGGPQSTYRGRPSRSSDLPIAFSSYPNLDLSSWTAGVAPGNLGASVRAYAICARSHVYAADIVSGHLAVTGIDSTILQCKTGQLLTQGGYYSDASDDRFKPVYSQPEGPAPASCSFEARFAYLGSGIPPSATTYGICVRYS
jgi:hypothetical protein